MISRTLNRDIKLFVQGIKNGAIDPFSAAAKEQFIRLHDADPTFMGYDVDSLRSMIILNRLYNYVKELAPHADL